MLLSDIIFSVKLWFAQGKMLNCWHEHHFGSEIQSSHSKGVEHELYKFIRWSSKTEIALFAWVCFLTGSFLFKIFLMLSSNMWSEFQCSVYSWFSTLFLFQVARNIASWSRSMNISVNCTTGPQTYSEISPRSQICFSRSSLQFRCPHALTLYSALS